MVERNHDTSSGARVAAARSERAGPEDGAPPPPGDRLMVCVGAGPRSELLVRAASAWATRLGAPWFAVHVESESSSAAERDRAASCLLLAERLGARPVTLTGTGRRVDAELLTFARTNAINLLLIGRAPRGVAPRLRSPTGKITRRARNIDVLVVDGNATDSMPSGAAANRSHGRRGRLASGYLWAMAIVLACTVITAYVTPHIGVGNADAIYLLAVVIVAARHGRGPAVLTSVVGLLAFDYVVVPPPFGFVPEDATYLVTFAVMLAVALTVSALAARLRREAHLSRQRFARMATMHDFAADLAGAADGVAVALVVERHLQRLYRCPTALLTPDAKGVLRPVVAVSTLTERDVDAAAEAFAAGTAVGSGCDRRSDVDSLHLPLRAGSSTVGVLSLLDSRDRFDVLGERTDLEAFANQTALALERADLAAIAQRAVLEADQERLHNTLLRSVSHDLRTPVAAIQGAASTLLQSDALGAGTRRELLQSICDATDRLGRQIHNLLEVTRLETGSVRPCVEWTPLDEVVGAALNVLDDRLRGRHLLVELPDDLPPLPLDGLLAQQVIINLVDNALRHTPAGSPVDLVARCDAGHVVLEVSDCGPGIPAGEEERVFAKFYRIEPSRSAAGTGLGLAIARAIMDLLGGRIWVEPRTGGGATFRVAFPCASPLLPALDAQLSEEA